jgi:hypothetical protein
MRLLRHLLNAATVLSLLLCAATVGLWARSYWVCDSAKWWHPTKRVAYAVACSRGRVGFETYERRYPMNSPDHYKKPPGAYATEPLPASEFEEGWPVPLETRRTFMGFAYLSATLYGAVTTRIYIVPLWPVTLLTALAPARYWLGDRKRRWRASGFCSSCGYDLRATPDRCPECGAIPKEVKA